LCRRRSEKATENDDEEAKEFEGEETKFKSRIRRRHRNRERENVMKQICSTFSPDNELSSTLFANNASTTARV